MSQYTAQSIASLLEKALGAEPAKQLVDAAMKQVGVSAEAMDLNDAQRVLDHVAEQPGLPGVIARFAKARLHLAKTA